MKTVSRHRMTRVALSIGVAAALAPAARAAFPDGDPPAAAANDRAAALGARARIEPRPAGTEALPSAPAGDPVAGTDGFDWADAAVGAGIAVGGSALVGGTLVAIRRHGGRGRLATR